MRKFVQNRVGRQNSFRIIFRSNIDGAGKVLGLKFLEHFDVARVAEHLIQREAVRLEMQRVADLGELHLPGRRLAQDAVRGETLDQLQRLRLLQAQRLPARQEEEVDTTTRQGRQKK